MTGRITGWTAFIVFALTLPAALFAANAHLLLSDDFISSEYAKPGFPASERYSPAERLRISRTVIAHLEGRASTARLSGLRTGSGGEVFTEREVSHLVDVREVFRGVGVAGLVCVALVFLSLAATVLVAGQGRRTAAAGRLLAWGTAAAIALSVALAAFAAVNFNSLFLRFHDVFFAAGTFLFAPDSTLIQLYPEEFWIDATLRLLLMTLGEAALIAAIGMSLLLGVRLGPRGRGRPRPSPE